MPQDRAYAKLLRIQLATVQFYGRLRPRSRAVADIASRELLRVLRSYLLPISPDLEAASLKDVDSSLSALGLTDEREKAAWLRLELESWRETGKPSDDLRTKVIQPALIAGVPGFGHQLALGYASLHALLQTSAYDLDFDEVTILISYARLAGKLAKDESMTSAQIANILSARHSAIRFHWRAVQALLQALGAAPDWDPKGNSQVFERVKTLLSADKEEEPIELADASLSDCCARIGEIAQHLLFPSDLGQTLNELYPDPPNGSYHAPYLEILLNLCVQAEFYDHPPYVLYEFSPRGKIANYVYECFPPRLKGAGNPVLDNAKSVENLDLTWATTKYKRGKLPKAKALAAIAAGLSEMSFPARRELARWIRLWLFRIIRINEPLHHTSSETLTTGQIRNALNAVESEETGTSGVIEQRVVDALSSLVHRGGNWRPRGLGDAVNTSNTSQRKLGDCDFQDSSAHEVVGYEAHAGVLTDVYLREHLRVLARTMSLRRAELEAVADPQLWQIRIVFVAHGFRLHDRPTQGVFDGITVRFLYQTYKELELSSGMTPTSELDKAFIQRVVGPLNSSRTPDQFRVTFNSLLESG